MPDLEKEFEKTNKLFEKHKSICIISHRNPDADTIGANLALRNFILTKFKKNVVSACADPLPFTLLFLPESDKVKTDIDIKKIDLLVAVDCSSKEQMKFHEKIKDFFNKKIPLINIDHHSSNKKYGDYNLIKSDAASTTEILYRYFQYMNFNITKDIATCLLSGIYCDTGSFMHSNTTRESYEIAENLSRAGASINEIIKYMYKIKTIEQLKLWGRVFSNAKINKQGTMVSKVTSADFDDTETNPRDLSGIINYLNSVPECKMSILLAEDMKGSVKGSIRSGENGIDVSEVCEQLGGGGHKKAAGFKVPGKIVSEEIWRIEK